jgi:hypothetical protein
LDAPPAAPAYHAAFDRTDDADSSQLWDFLGPNGSVTVSDIQRLVAQFGHSCIAAP